MDEDGRAEREADHRAAADPPRVGVVAVGRGVAVSVGLPAEGLGRDGQAEADERHDDDRAARVGEPRERLAQREREERPRPDRRVAAAKRAREPVRAGGDEDRLREDEPGDREAARTGSVIVASEPSRPS